MSPRPRARIDLAALRHNLARARRAAPGRRLMAVVKADGYGHGAIRVARALERADAFAVARLEEALELRAAGIDKRIVVLPGVLERAEVAAAAAAGIDLVVQHEGQIGALEAARSPLAVWLKIDTGMHRLGVPPARAQACYRRLAECPQVRPPVRLMTHLAEADDRASPATGEQLEVFARACAGLEAERSIANSAALLGWPAAHGDWLRPGLMLYGASPFLDSLGAEEGLRAVMTLETRLIAVNRIPAGGRIGYGGTWTCPEEMAVGVAAIGYGDGYLRHAPSGTPVLVGGRRAPLIGRVSMDAITIDLRGLPGARPGDPVVLWGEGLPVEEVARAMGTIPYEPLTRVAPRVERVVVGE